MTNPQLWLLAAGASAGLALAWATRWKPDSRQLRGWLVPLGFNLAAASLLAAVLLAGNGSQNLVHEPVAGALAVGVGLAAAFLSLRFPRVAGIPLVLAGGVLAWQLNGELQGFVSVEETPFAAQARMLAQTPQSRTVELRVAAGNGLVDEAMVELRGGDWPLAQVELLTFPEWVPWPSRHFFRPKTDRLGLSLLPAGWARTLTVASVKNPEPFALYRLVLGPGPAGWVKTLPTLPSLQP